MDKNVIQLYYENPFGIKHTMTEYMVWRLVKDVALNGRKINIEWFNDWKNNTEYKKATHDTILNMAKTKKDYPSIAEMEKILDIHLRHMKEKLLSYKKDATIFVVKPPQIFVECKENIDGLREFCLRTMIAGVKK